MASLHLLEQARTLDVRQIEAELNGRLVDWRGLLRANAPGRCSASWWSGVWPWRPIRTETSSGLPEPAYSDLFSNTHLTYL